jgi:UDP-N-acetylglucosamine 2-epimerase (non-hydrolysing)
VKHAKAVITDSGGITEECTVMHVPCLTLRDNTERPETVFCGSNVISGLYKDRIIDCYNTMKKNRGDWVVPSEYNLINVSDTIINILMGV